MRNMSIVGEDIAIDAYCVCSEVRLCVFFRFVYDVSYSNICNDCF